LRRRAGGFALLFVYASLSACAAPPDLDRLAGTDELLANFEHVVFRDEYDETRNIDRIRKWSGPVRIALFGEQAERYRPVVERHAAALGRLTGLDFTVLPDADGSENFRVHLVPWDDMEALAKPYSPEPEWLETIIEESSCLFVFTYNGAYVITQAIVLVSTDERYRDNTACLLEEMTQALGLPNDSELIRPSIFNQWDFLQRLALNDQILIRTLYDGRVRHGMPREPALTAARGIITEILDRVRRGGPEALLASP
jgi:hypothetical protein